MLKRETFHFGQGGYPGCNVGFHCANLESVELNLSYRLFVLGDVHTVITHVG
jgi:hypothetical protein